MKDRNQWSKGRFSLKTLLILVAIIALYMKSWSLTQDYGVEPETAQYSPVPFVVVERGIPRFRKDVSLDLTEKRTCIVWFFGLRHALFDWEFNESWDGRSRREQNEIIKGFVAARAELKRTANDQEE